MRVLIIDDDPGVRRVLCSVLEEEGYVVVAASNGAEGLRAASEERFEFILCELRTSFETVDHLYDGFRGWIVDNVKVTNEQVMTTSAQLAVDIPNGKVVLGRKCGGKFCLDQMQNTSRR